LPDSRPNTLHDLALTLLGVDAYQGVCAIDITKLFSFIDDRVADGERIPRGAVSQVLTLRQARGVTATGRGVLVPHAAVRRLPCSRLIHVQLLGVITVNTLDNIPVRDVLALLVRCPPTLADHALLERIRDPYMNRILIELLRPGQVAEVYARLVKRA